MSDLDEIRSKLEREKEGAPQVYYCSQHGERTTLICVPCYGIQQERVERESLPLRLANTCEAMRARVVAQLAPSNGHAH